MAKRKIIYGLYIFLVLLPGMEDNIGIFFNIKILISAFNKSKEINELLMLLLYYSVKFKLCFLVILIINWTILWRLFFERFLNWFQELVISFSTYFITSINMMTTYCSVSMTLMTLIVFNSLTLSAVKLIALLFIVYKLVLVETIQKMT